MSQRRESQQSGPGIDLDRVGREYEVSRPAYEGYADALRVLITQLCKSAGLPFDQITARAKETSSVVDKMRRRNYRSIDEMIDKCGVRVITRYESTVERVCALLATEFEVLQSVEHGFQEPQAFGYTSRHLVVRLAPTRASLLEWREFTPLVAEVQVRSILQHAWASISHSLDYKFESSVPDAMRRRLYRVAALLETGDELFNRYQEEAEALVRTYRTEAEQDDWRGLPIDLESILATVNKFPWDNVVAAAKEAGWRPDAAYDVERALHPLEDAEQDRWTWARLVDLAVQAGLQRVGDLSHYAEQIDTLRERLRQLADRSKNEGYTPVAYGPDIIALLVVEDYADRFRTRSNALDAYFVDELWKAALDEGGEVGEVGEVIVP